MAKKSAGNKNLNTLLVLGGIGVGLYLAWTNNFLGIQDLVNSVSSGIQEIATPLESEEEQLIKMGISPQQTHKTQYPMTYPYPPAGYPQTAAATTLPAAHYQIAGTPNLMIPSAGGMPNPYLWTTKGGIMNPTFPFNQPYYEYRYGPYWLQSPQFSREMSYYVPGTNIDYPFLIGPTAPSPCPIGQYRAGDGRCYPYPTPPPEICLTGYYRASDGRCYPLLP